MPRGETEEEIQVKFPYLLEINLQILLKLISFEDETL